MRGFDRRLESLEASRQAKIYQHIAFTNNSTEIKGTPRNFIYIPSKTGEKFHADETFIKIMMGPFGSGKSTTCINDIVMRACKMPYWHKGRRKSRWIIVRNTSGELESTTLQTWLTWFGELGDIKPRKKPILTYEHTFNDGNGIVELELIFLALDKEKDVRKLKSFEATGAYINELSEVPQSALSIIKGRVNHRYPSPEFCPEPYWSGIIADTNPPDVDHWMYKDFEEQVAKSVKIFKQPPGLLRDEQNNWYQNPDCDNYKHLAHDYYIKLSENQKEGFVKVYCLGEYGAIELNKRVYPEYNDDLHSVPKIEAIQGMPLILGWDFGLTPACIVGQVTARGHLRILKEYIAENMGIRTFAESIVIPSIERDFPYNKIGDSEADPSGANRDGILEELSCINELNTLGIPTQAAGTNDIEPRIASVRFFLNTMIDGQPAYLVSREGAPRLRKGFISNYYYRRLAVAGEERYQEAPYKNEYSHPHDANQYICLKLAPKRIAETKAQKPAVDMSNPVFRWSN